MVNGQVRVLQVEGRSHDDGRYHDINWNHISYFFRISLHLLDDAETNEHEERSCSSNTVNPTGKRLKITCIDDRWPDNADWKILLSLLYQSLAKTLGIGVSIWKFAENGLGVLNQFVECQTFQILEKLLRIVILIVNFLLY